MKRQVDPKKIEQLLNRIRHLDDGRLERGGEKEIVGLLERAKDESAGKSKEIAEIGKETLNWFIKDKKWMLGFFDEILKLAQEYGEKIYCWNCQGEPVPGVLAYSNTSSGIQRCDICKQYEGDLEAALALAKSLGGRVIFLGSDGKFHNFNSWISLEKLPAELNILGDSDPVILLKGKVIGWEAFEYGTNLTWVELDLKDWKKEMIKTYEDQIREAIGKAIYL